MSFAIGDQVGDYQVVGTVGSGGAGRVFRVKHAITGRVEAMKVLLEGRAGAAESAERFQREIKLQAKLDHPGIASVHNAFWNNEELVMIMELIDGSSLNRLIAAGPAKLGPAMRFGMQCLESLAYAHQQGVTHRDVKPENIMVSTNGWVKLMDFGLAKEARDPKLTQKGSVVGSAFYISPEQARGSESVDRRTDIYSFGAVLYELVTGKKPFDYNNTYDLLQASVSQQPTPPIELRPEMPLGLNNAILRAMAKNPAKRFQSAEEFRVALEAVAADPNAVVEPPSRDTATHQIPPSPELRAQQRRRILFVAAGLIAVVYLGLQQIAFDDSVESGNMARVEASVSGPDLGGYSALQTLTVDESTSHVSFTSDARQVIVAGNSSIQMIDVSSGTERLTLEGLDGRVNEVAISPDGRWLSAAGDGSEATLWDVTSQEITRRLTHADQITALAFSSDSLHIATGSADGTIRVWDLLNPGDSSVLAGPEDGPVDLVFNPTAALLASAGDEAPVSFWSIKQDTSEQLEGSFKQIEQIIFSASGLELVAFGGPEIIVWDVPSRSVRDRFAAPGKIHSVAKSPTRGWLSLGTSVDVPSILELRTMGSQELLVAIPHSTSIVAASLASDGEHFASVTAGGTLTIWKSTGL
jgi:serine/threonine protein kinase